MLQIKTIGSNGQLSLGKAFAGMAVMVEQLAEGSWLIKAGTFVPDSEKWLHEPKVAASLDRALAWAENHEPQDNFDELVKKIESTHKKSRTLK